MISLSKVQEDWDLTSTAPLLTADHPKIIRARLEAEIGNIKTFPTVSIPGFSYVTFSNLSEALKKFPQAMTIQGYPYNIHTLLQHVPKIVAIDFNALGAIVLFEEAQPLPNELDLASYCLATWTSYALSPELWGERGKWARFHGRLMHLFETKKCQRGECLPGYYQLTPSAAVLARHGLRGEQLDNSYLLVLPWTFSLSALEKLERIILQEM
jgi:hypothetical protein